MELLLFAYYENLKRLVRRRKYQKLNTAPPSSTHPQLNKRRLKISRVGRPWRPRSARELDCKFVSTPIECLAKFHDAYVDMMICVAKKVVNPTSIGGFLGGRRAAKARQFALVSSCEEVVDRDR